MAKISNLNSEKYKFLLFKNIFSKPNLWLVSIVRLNWKIGLVSAGLGIFASILEGLSTSLILPLTSYLSQKSSSAPATLLPLPVEKMLANLGVNNSFAAFILIFWLLILFKNTVKYYSDFSSNKLKFLTGKNIREILIKKFLALELFFYNSAKVGEMITLVNDHAERSLMLSGQFFVLITEVSTVICLLTVATYLSPQITLISIVSFSFLVFVLKPLLAIIKKQSRKAASEATKFSGLVTEILDGIRVIKAFGLEEVKVEESNFQLNNRCQSEITLYKYGCAIFPVTEATGITIMLVVLITWYFLNNSNNLLPVLLTYSIVMLRMLPRVNNINNIFSQFSVMEGSLSLIYEFLYSQHWEHKPLSKGFQPTIGLDEEISIKNLVFKYPKTDKSVINNISLTIKHGQKIALVGQSGSGKSTLVDLIMRYYDPDEGSISVDGINLRELNLTNWRSSIAVVIQDTFLFNTSILENIRCGKFDASVEEIEEAAKNAYALEFIEHLPNGFETLVGQRGAMLSGGQKQRIAIARAFLRNPKLLILDEATSALDTASEVFVQKAIEKISEGRTVITIAHRLSTVKNADLIITLKAGEIVEIGNHKQLLENQGEYWLLHNQSH